MNKIKNSPVEIELDLSETTGLTSIGKSAFPGCNSITKITIPDSVITIEWGAFMHCDNLSSILIPTSVTSLGKQIFYRCNSLESVTIGDGVTDLSFSIFEDCINLKNLTLGSGIRRIEGSKSIQNIGLGNLQSVVFDNSDSQWTVEYYTTIQVGEYQLNNITLSVSDPIQNAIYFGSTYCGADWSLNL